MLTGSLSRDDKQTSTRPSNSECSWCWRTVRKPRSVLLCSHKMTDVPQCTASSMSWCDISPVINKSACTPDSTAVPEPAHTATLFTSPSVTIYSISKHKGMDTCSAAYTSHTPDQQHFTISEVAADWHEPMVPQCIMWPSTASANGQLDPRCS